VKKTAIKKKTARPMGKLKKDVWDVFSRFIRYRDCMRTTGCKDWGLCITCSRRYHFKLLQSGHFIPGRHNANLFQEKGVHAQCYNCNINLRGNTLEYRRQIIKLYGEGYDEILEEEAKEIKKFTREELENLKNYYKKQIGILERGE